MKHTLQHFLVQLYTCELFNVKWDVIKYYLWRYSFAIIHIIQIDCGPRLKHSPEFLFHDYNFFLYDHISSFFSSPVICSISSPNCFYMYATKLLNSLTVFNWVKLLTIIVGATTKYVSKDHPLIIFCGLALIPHVHNSKAWNSHRSLSGKISCVTDRIRFLPVTMIDRLSNFNSISYTDDWHELRMTGTKCRLPDTMFGTGKIFISGPGGQ